MTDASRRVEHLYEISKLFASFESVEETFDAALGVAAKMLPLRSAILIEREDGKTKMIVWPSDGQDAEQMRTAKRHVEEAYGYLIGAAANEHVTVSEEAGITVLPGQVAPDPELARRFIVLPIVVAHRPPFGALQLEGAEPLDESDLMFVNAIANQLAIALDRDHAWRRDIQSARAREQILEIVSHDLRNPLGSILMAARALIPGEPNGPTLDLHQSVQMIERSAKRMLRLIEDLLDFGSIEAGRLSIKPGPEDPGSLIQETIATFEAVAEQRRLQLTAEVEPHLPEVDCDRHRILQVFSNLVGNATQVLPEGGHITLRAGVQAHEVLFEVADDGPGIGEEELKHLFERYWRSDEMCYRGTGLGLAIASGIVDAHHGRMWAASEPGKGATFRFTIPLK